MAQQCFILNCIQVLPLLIKKASHEPAPFRCQPETLGAPTPKALDFPWFTGCFFLPQLIKIQAPIYLTRGV